MCLLIFQSRRNARACLPIFWTENIRHAHIEPYPRDRQNIFYICFVSSHDSHVAEAGIIRAARCDNATRKPLCFASVSLFIQREISAVSRPIAAKLCHTIGNGCDFKNYVQNFWILPPKNGTEKHAFWRDFGRLRTLIANISRKEQDIDNRNVRFQPSVFPLKMHYGGEQNMGTVIGL